MGAPPGLPVRPGLCPDDRADVFDYRCEPEELRKRAEECEQLGRAVLRH